MSLLICVFFFFYIGRIHGVNMLGTWKLEKEGQGNMCLCLYNCGLLCYSFSLLFTRHYTYTGHVVIKICIYEQKREIRQVEKTDIKDIYIISLILGIFTQLIPITLQPSQFFKNQINLLEIMKDKSSKTFYRRPLLGLWERLLKDSDKILWMAN